MGGFLHQFKAGAAADHKDAVIERQIAGQKFVANYFIERIVAADIFFYHFDSAVAVKQAGGMQTACAFKVGLEGSQLANQGVNKIR